MNPRIKTIENCSNKLRKPVVFGKQDPSQFPNWSFWIGQFLDRKCMFVACKFSGKAQHILHWILEQPCGPPPPGKCVSHLLDGNCQFWFVKLLVFHQDLKRLGPIGFSGLSFGPNFEDPTKRNKHIQKTSIFKRHWRCRENMHQSCFQICSSCHVLLVHVYFHSCPSRDGALFLAACTCHCAHPFPWLAFSQL